MQILIKRYWERNETKIDIKENPSWYTMPPFLFHPPPPSLIHTSSPSAARRTFPSPSQLSTITILHTFEVQANTKAQGSMYLQYTITRRRQGGFQYIMWFHVFVFFFFRNCKRTARSRHNGTELICTAAGTLLRLFERQWNESTDNGGAGRCRCY